MDILERERTRIRNSIVDGYQRVLPRVQQSLCTGAEAPSHRHIPTRREGEGDLY